MYVSDKFVKPVKKKRNINRRYNQWNNPLKLFYSRIKKIKLPLMWMALLLTGIWIILLNLYADSRDIKRFSPIEGEVYGEVCDIEEKYNKTYYTLKDIHFNGEDTKEMEDLRSSDLLLKKSGCICTFDEKEDGVYIGSHLRLRGEISIYDKAYNPGEFDSRKYYFSKGYIFKANSCILMDSDQKKNAGQFFYTLRNKIGRLTDESLNRKDAGILKALIIADKTDLDKDTKELYKDAGTSHLLAISGLHITLLASAVLFLLKKTPLNLNAAYIVTVLILFFYGRIIGFSPSSLRAIIMFSILCLGRILKKSYDTLTAMAVSAFVTMLIKPLSVLQTGFLMSYLAIVGIAVVMPVFTPIGKRLPKIISSLAMSASVSLSTLPIAINSYYRISLFSPFLNILLIPGMSIILLTGILCIVMQAFLNMDIFANIGWCIPNIFAVVIHYMFELYEWIMNIELSIPHALVTVGARSLLRCIIFEGVLIVGSIVFANHKLDLWRRIKLINNRIHRDAQRMNQRNVNDNFERNKREIKRIRKSKTIGIVLAAFCMIINLFGFLFYYRNDKIEFLSVGQGLCACVQYKGYVYCFDGGSSDRKNIYEYVIKPYMLYYGIGNVDAWFLSHEDSDHTNGVKDALKKDSGIKVRKIIIPKVLEEKFTEISSLADDNGTMVYTTKAWDVFTYDNSKNNYWHNKENNNRLSFTVISPNDKFSSVDSNAASLVVLMKVKEGNVLFMADSGTEAEKLVTDYLGEDIRIDVLQIAHHGSAINTNSEKFLRQINPRISVISCGFENSYGHPHQETMDILSGINTRIIRTDYDGALKILLK